MNGQRHRGDGEGRGGRHGDGGIVPVDGGILVGAVVVLLVSSEGASVTVRLAAALGQAGERLRRPGEESKLFSKCMTQTLLRMHVKTTLGSRIQSIQTP